MEIDHVLNEALADRPDECKEVLTKHGLPESFDLFGRLNLVCACKRCNSKKGADRPTALIEFGLKAARKKAPIIENLLVKYPAMVKADEDLTRVGVALQRGDITRKYVADFLRNETAAILPRTDLHESELLRILGNASTGLLTWPQRIGGTWLERPESDSLLTKLDRPSSFTVLLGEPGSGKSALLAHLAEGLPMDRVALLALKADLLPPELGTLAALQEHLGTPAPLADCLKELAESRTVVLLIDQLDAVSDLMVQHTSRLTVLLRLIDRLRGIENLHILLSCRSFEFKHDLRLTSLKPDSVTLEDPPFKAVEQLLTAIQIDSTNWPGEAKELLRRPQHLSFFIQHLAKDQPIVLRSYQAMMESVLHARVSKPFGESTERALEAIAAAMSTEEDLWLPVARFRISFGTEIDRLVASDILAYSPEKLRMGFRHQTIFDFVRARAFASGVASLAQHVLEQQDSLFVRPILWSTLHYLREADRTAYRRELQRLWGSLELRQHIRFLLITFLGRVADPDSIEIGLVHPGLSDPRVKGQIIKSIQGNPAWFAQIAGDMPSMMQGDEVSIYFAAWLLRPALTFNTDSALALIERCWVPDSRRDAITIQTLSYLKQWSERAAIIAETCIRRTPRQDIWGSQLPEVVSQSRPDLAPRLIAAELWALLEKATAEPIVVPEVPPADSPVVDQAIDALRYGDAAYAAVRKIVTDSSRWHGISKIAAASPKTFIEQIWPWVLHVAIVYAAPVEREWSLSYREDRIFDFESRFHEDLTSGIEVAIAGFADEAPDAFLKFASENQDCQIHCIHRLFAIGYCRLAKLKPQECADYLLGDSRRFALGHSRDQHKDSKDLISAFTPYSSRETVKTLEVKIREWVYYPRRPDLGVETRFDRMKWSKEARIRVLSAIPLNLLSPEATKLLTEVEHVLPNTKAPDRNATLVMIKSPVSSTQMASASRKSLMRLFDELHDGTGRGHPRDFMKGGVVEASREFGALAKTHPALVLPWLQDLKPGKHERYAAEAIRNLSEPQACDPKELLRVIHRLSAKGFGSEDFRTHASWSFSKLAEELQGLDDATCALIESWLVEWTRTPTEPASNGPSEEGRVDSNSRSILWDGNGGILPQGNYPPLEALFRGYMLRETRDVSGWLRVLERHVERNEDPRVWIALAGWQLKFIGEADRKRASNLLKSVFTKPEILGNEKVVCLVAQLHSWLPPALTGFCLDQWQAGSWRLGPQAVGEVAMLRHCLVKEDEYCRELVESIITGSVANSDILPAMRLGIVFAAAEIWAFPKARAEATRVLLAVLPPADEAMVKAWRRVFHYPWTTVDDCSRQILDALKRNRALLRVQHNGQLIDRLKELLEHSLEAERVCSVVEALLEECGDDIGDFRTGWAAAAGDLIDIALTLERLPGTSSGGLEIFERLMAGNAFQLEDVLLKLDRRLPL